MYITKKLVKIYGDVADFIKFIGHITVLCSLCGRLLQTVAWSVCLSVCLSQLWAQHKQLMSSTNHGKGQLWSGKGRPIVKYRHSLHEQCKNGLTNREFEMPFGVWTRVGPWNHVSDGDRDRPVKYKGYAVSEPPLPSNTHHWINGDCLDGKRVCSGLFCAILCATIVHSAMHTYEQT